MLVILWKVIFIPDFDGKRWRINREVSSFQSSIQHSEYHHRIFTSKHYNQSNPHNTNTNQSSSLQTHTQNLNNTLHTLPTLNQNNHNGRSSAAPTTICSAQLPQGHHTTGLHCSEAPQPASQCCLSRLLWGAQPSTSRKCGALSGQFLDAGMSRGVMEWLELNGWMHWDGVSGCFWDWWNLKLAWNGSEISYMSRIIVNVNNILFCVFDLLLGHVFTRSEKLSLTCSSQT